MTDDSDSIDQCDGGESLPSIDGLLRAVAHAPRPQGLPVSALRLPGVIVATLARELPVPAVPRPGEDVDGRYRIEDTLGSGGMGIVYAARHLETGREVALKWMHLSAPHRSGSDRDVAFQRFLREAQATGRIQHPNVVKLHDAGRDPRAPFLVMERLHGATLRTHMQERGTLAWDEALALALPAMAGVAEAHRCGVVHRDLKPDNVFLARERDGVVPKVLDFGVSRLRSEGGTGDETALTRTGAVLGTPAYMPLEQLRAAGELDERTDVYALGVMLYEMLAGRRPYEARNAADFAALLASEPPVPLGRYRPDLRGPREAAVMRALARHPVERPESVDAFAALLRRAARTPARRTVILAVALGMAIAASAIYHAKRGDLVKGSPAASSSFRAAAARPLPQPLERSVAAPLPQREAAVVSPAEPHAAAGHPAIEARSPLRGRVTPPAPRKVGGAQRSASAEPHPSGPTPTSLNHADFSAPSGELVPLESARRAPVKAPSLSLGRDQF